MFASTLLFAILVASDAASWSQLLPTDANATLPAARSGNAYATVAGGLFLQGGCSSGRCESPLSDSWLGNFASGAGNWTQLVNVGVSASQASRYAHAAASLNSSSAVVFGGANATDIWGDLWTVSVAPDGVTAVWQNIMPQPAGGAWPSARATHTLTPSPDGSVALLHGGVDANGRVLGDSFLLNLSASPLTWSPVLGTSGPARTRHSVVAVPGSSPPVWLLFGGADAGGVDQNDVWQLQAGAGGWGWALLFPGGNASSALPAPRRSHVIWFDEGGDEGVMMAFGGQVAGASVGDQWALDISSGLWNLIDAGVVPPSPVQPNARSEVSGLILNVDSPAGDASFVVAFGVSGASGEADDTFHSDVWARNAC